MEKNKSRIKRKAGGKNENDYFYKIIGVQLLACIFMAILLAVVCRLDADNIREKYNKLMLRDMSWHEVWQSAKETAWFVFKPMETGSVKETAGTQKESAPQSDDGSQTDGEAEKDDSSQAENDQAPSGSRETAEVLSMFSSDAKITLPVHGRISSRFGSRVDPISGENAVHRAVDIAVSEGTRVGAAWDGIVTQAGSASKKGIYVWMVHRNGCETLYCHLSEITVKKGDVIRAGETIAYSGNTGYSTGPHLHFGIRKNGEMVNPLNYIKETDGYI